MAVGEAPGGGGVPVRRSTLVWLFAFAGASGWVCYWLAQGARVACLCRRGGDAGGDGVGCHGPHKHGAVRTGLKIRYGNERVVLSVDGRSADIDGSTVHRDLAGPGWTKFHNDTTVRREAFEASIQGMTSCVVAFGPAA